MVSRLILNLRNQASRPHRPKTGEFSLFSAYPVSYASTGAITSTISQNKFAETDRQHLVSTIIGNLGEPLDFEGDEAMQSDVLDQNANAEQKDPADLESGDAIQLSTRLDSVGNLSRSATEDDTSSRFRVMKDGCKSL